MLSPIRGFVSNSVSVAETSEQPENVEENWKLEDFITFLVEDIRLLTDVADSLWHHHLWSSSSFRFELPISISVWIEMKVLERMGGERMMDSFYYKYHKQEEKIRKGETKTFEVSNFIWNDGTVKTKSWWRRYIKPKNRRIKQSLMTCLGKRLTRSYRRC